MNELIKIEKINKKHYLGENTLHVLQDIDLEINLGEFTAIIGPSGSGKSTLMNILGCLDRPTSGSYYLHGEDVSNLTDDQLAEVRNRRIGFVFQSFNLLPRISAQDNVAMPLIYSGIDGKERMERAAQLLTRVGLGDRMHHKPNELSGGQRQRVAIARALVNNPSIIMADEPTGNLDSKSSVEIMEIFRELNAAEKTIILVTHDPEVAQQAKRIVTVRDGRII